MFVRDHMSKPVITTDPEATILEALQVMEDHRIHRLPVVDGARLVGIVTWRDLVRTRVPGALPIDFLRGRVRTVMTAAPVTVSPDTFLEHAAVLMRDRRVGALPVVDQAELVGIVTESDIFTALLELLGARCDGVRLIVRLRDPATSLRAVLDAVGRTGQLLRGIVTMRQDGQGHAVITTEARDPRPLIRALEDAGFPVVFAEVKDRAA